MPIVEIDKEAGAIVFTMDDGTTVSYTVSAEDCVVSVPPKGFRKVHNVYINPETGAFMVSYEE